MTDATFTVGQLAAELGVTTRTLRFYEEAGIVTPARTGAGAARAYASRDRARLSLAEIREIVDMYDAEPGEDGQIRRLLSSLERVRADLESRQEQLTRTLTEVDDVTRRCQDRLSVLAGVAGIAPGPPRSPSPKRTSPPTGAQGSRSGKVADGPSARGGSAGQGTTYPSPTSGAKSR